MKIVVIEDQKKFNQKIVKVINQILEKRNLEIEIVSFFKFDSDLSNIIKNEKGNLYILDIELPNKNGGDIARMIRYEVNDWKSLIVIVSVYNQKAEYSSLFLQLSTYLSKFDNFDKNLYESVDLAIGILIGDGILKIEEINIPIDDILYIKKEKNTKYCIIKTLNDEFRVRKNIIDLQKETNLKLIKKNLLINQRNVVFRNDFEIVFKNNIIFDQN